MEKLKDYDVNLSRKLSWLLRHGIDKEKLLIGSDGYVLCEDILKLKQFNRFNFDDIKIVVERNNKKRFVLKEINEKLYIKAIQGHSESIASKLIIDDLLIKINEPLDFVIHGTTMEEYNTIKISGLKIKDRWLIHFSTSVNFIEQSHMPSKYRTKCRILIYLNMRLAMEDGIEFRICDNNIIHSSGNEGIIDPKYFLDIIDNKTNINLKF